MVQGPGREHTGGVPARVATYVQTRWEKLTQILRSGSPQSLREYLFRTLAADSAAWHTDRRDLFIVLAPFHDCARRLEMDRPTLFDEAANHAVADLADTVREFGARPDIVPSAWDFVVRDTPEGPEYAQTTHGTRAEV